MAAIRNVALEMLRDGKLALGLGVFQLQGASVPLLAREAGYDWLFIDMEHGPFTVHQVAQLSLSALATGIAPIVRIPAGAIDEGSRALDSGAMGVIVPHVDTAEQAESVVRALRFPPRGRRSWGSPPALLGYGGGAMADAMVEMEREILISVMIESPQAVENVEAIARVPGIDALMFGTMDLTIELGIPGQVGDPRIQAAYAKVIAACREQGLAVGMGPLGDAHWEAEYVRMGVRFVLGAGDHGLLLAAGKDNVARFRGMLAPADGKDASRP